MKRNEFVKHWRESLSISSAKMAACADLDEKVVHDIEAGALEPSVDELEKMARVLGLRGEDLYDEEVPDSAAPDSIRLLLKSAEAFSPSEDVRIRMLDAARAAMDLLELRDALKEMVEGGRFEKLFEPAPLVKTKKSPYQLGASLAKEARKKMGIQGPLSSVRDLVTSSFGIPIVAADLGAHGPDAFSVFAPGRRAAIVLNIVGKNENKLVARFSVAHELGHILFDRPALGALGIACKTDPRQSMDVEARANAFAMRLLLPERELAKLGPDIYKPSVFRATMEHWGVHYGALRLDVQKLRDLSDDEAERDIPGIESVDPTCPLLIRDAEELPAEREVNLDVPWPRRGPLLALAASARNRGLISQSRLRELIRVDATLPFERLAQVLDLPTAQAWQ